MYFQSFMEAFHMDGHGAYVWGCYGLFLLMIAWNFWRIRKQRQRQLRRLFQVRSRQENG